MLNILLSYYENNLCSSIVSFGASTNIQIGHIYFITSPSHEVVELKVDRKTNLSIPDQNISIRASTLFQPLQYRMYKSMTP